MEKKNVINPKNKLPFLINQKVNKEEIQQQLTKLNSKPPEVDGRIIEYFAILSSKETNTLEKKE